jgi:glycosyltransferase involved in cell wall biosynthesis
VDASIVIATRDRRALLDRTLATIAGFPAGYDFEVVVADHGSTDGTDELVDRYAARFPVRRVPVPFTGESIAVPKNAGARAARGEVLILLDSGMLCPTHFLAAHLAAHRARPGGVVAGAVFGWDSEDEREPFWQALDLASLPGALPARYADPRAARWPGCAEAAWMLVWGANMSLSRADFVHCGGFDAGLTGWGWDDIELAYRLDRDGRRPRYAPGAWAAHLPHPRAPLAARVASATRNWKLVYRRHRAPELETWEACDYWDHAACHRRLRATVAGLAGRLPKPPVPDRPGQRRVLYGFGPHPAEAVDTRLTLPGTPAGEVGSYGLYTGLPDGHAELAVASPALLAFDWNPSPGWPPLAVRILRELARIAGTVRVCGLDAAGRARLGELADLSGLPPSTVEAGTA